MIERNHLAILRAVEQDGSLTAAADRLHLTQSALSHAIKKLEQQLGTPVWEREGRRLRPTQAGQYLLGLAGRLLPQLEHAEDVIARMAAGERGVLRIGMECHPCYQWLLKIVGPYLTAWPGVDVDVKQQFQFGGMAALFGHDIDLLVTPDPLHKPGVEFTPVFEYEQVLVVADSHSLAQQSFVRPEQLVSEVLISYPVPVERLDIFSHFMLPAGVAPRSHKTIETTDILLHTVAVGRGVAALPGWLVEEYAASLPIKAISLGEKKLHKQIYVGVRSADRATDYIDAFISQAATP
ncbi:LysR family transcriptional regulator [Gilvimarinus agarilyticus]|uniref:LysR family transcriptional regulator n=1 Tax=unclassified Gilvimarinus TaxID=2642066 RepID=UPI001C087C5E|nr:MULTISPECIES: LysR family transcriptional regulator [unclassified Gilvimarinus]MBU2887527.1 LysR family transcriptional regulator [Gilvimarinus agarilyticus]MDO6572178.1 LysR family transcriptional regulator [Gilvimarinus sp. 2_MG-2023]MDO6746742.1 LysR family transcriptional regulator [Gilvimarinus sp. 1_MG-2023]